MTRRQELLRVGRQLRQRHRLRAGPRPGRAARAAAGAAHRGRRVLRAAVGQARVRRPVRGDRPARPLAVDAPAALLAAARGGPAARAGVAPVLPDRPAHLLGRRVAHRHRRARRLRAAGRCRAWATSSPTTTTLTKFKAAYVSGPPRGRRRRAATTDGSGAAGRDRSRTRSPPVAAGRRGADRARRRRPARPSRTETRAGLRHRGEPDEGPRPARAPGLAAAARRAELDGPAARRPRAAPRAAVWSAPGGASAGSYVLPVGIVDRPLEQRRELCVLRPRRRGRARGRRRWPAVAAAHDGCARIVTAIALTHDAAREPVLRASTSAAARFTPLAELPHVAGVADRQRARGGAPHSWPRCAASSTRASATSVRTASTRSRPTAAAGRPVAVDDGYGDVFLVVDGWPHRARRVRRARGADPRAGRRAV